jgi:glycosyltransferase involved in cell wall biosynthesis
MPRAPHESMPARQRNGNDRARIPAVPIKIALSILCENPQRKTGITTAYHEFVARSLKLYSDLRWLIFAGPNQEWHVHDPRVEVVRDFPANDQLKRRLLADHFQVPAVARARGADMMLSTGFVPVRKCLPTVMHVLSLQHLDQSNKLGAVRTFYRRWMMRYSWPKADLVITNSRFAAAQILSVFPQFKNHLLQAYEGLQHEQFHTAVAPGEAERLKDSIGVGPGYFLWLSNFYAYKQADRLLAGYALLDAQTRRRHPLVMVGADWEGHLLACQDQARASGIADDVKFLGWVGDEQLAPLYRHALAHCLPSREETFGRTVIESMACGTPVIVNDIPIMHEVTEGQALIVDFNQAAQVAQALKRMAGDAALRTRFREGGLARAQQFSFEKFTSERIGAIERFVSARRAA